MTLLSVTRPVKREITTRDTAFRIVALMARDWKTLDEPWERMRWAREATYEKASDAATRLQIEPGTYRSYERPTDQAGRWPKMAQLQRIASHFKVSWSWLQTGDGSPFQGVENSPLAREFQKALDEIEDAQRREDAARAALSVVQSFARKAS